MTKLKKSYRLTSDTVQKIEQLSFEENTSQANAIEIMVQQFFENREKERVALLEAIEKLVDQKLIENLSGMQEDLKRIRVTGNVIDRNVQMQLEFWNHYFIVNEFKELATTEKYKTEELTEAEVVVKNRIAHNRQRKLDWESKRKKDNNQTK
ncbi:hypothetical protein ACFSCZ_12520 [Siminovitchia sediminis]|uniref:Ribbon-helix-helix protein CopG domain-containing protein n=1 Tax=Siminovitchia sediminis TaxID=1274353 RepID=A0ABW4KMV0_9BACI